MKQARPSDLNDAVRHAVELEAYNRAERRKQEGQGYLCSTNTKEMESDSPKADSMETLTSTLKLIQDELKSLKTQRSGTGSRYYQQQQRGRGRPYQIPDRRTNPRRCFTCGSVLKTLHLVAAVGWFYPLPVIILEHAFPPTGFAVARLG